MAKGMNWDRAAKRDRDKKQPDLEAYYKGVRVKSNKQKAYELGAKLVKIEGATIETETEKAYLVVKGNEKYWVPKSKCAVNRNDKTVFMPIWMAHKYKLLDTT